MGHAPDNTDGPEGQDRLTHYFREHAYAKVHRPIMLSAEFLALRGVAVRVWLLLMSYADPRTAVAFPKVASMAKLLKIQENSIIRATKELEDAGLLEKGGHPTNPTRVTYALLVPPSIRGTFGVHDD